MAYQLISTYLADYKYCKAYLLFAHGRDDSDKEIFTVLESSRNLSTNFTLWNLDVVLRGAILGHQVKESIVNVDLNYVTVLAMRSQHFFSRTGTYATYELVFRASDIGDVHVVRGGTDIFL
jgi:hypothetical protein